MQRINIGITRGPVANNGGGGGNPGSFGGTLVDSETGEPLGLSLDPNSRERYAQALTAHIERVRQHCYGAQVQFTSVVAKEPLAQASIDTLTHMGLFV